MTTFSLFYWNDADAITGQSGFQMIHWSVEAYSAADAVRHLTTVFPGTYDDIERFLAVAPGVCSVVSAHGIIGDDWTPVVVITDN